MATFSTADELRVTPAGRDSQQAAKAVSLLRGVRERSGESIGAVQVPSLELPTAVLEALEAILDEVAEGHSVVVSTPERTVQELTTTQAAHELRMSRPTLIDILESGEIGYRMVGTHRRIPLTEVLEYKGQMAGTLDAARARRSRRLSALREMAEVSDEAGEGY